MRDSRDHSALKGFSVTYLSLLGALVLSIVLMGVIFILLAGQNEQNETQYNLASEQRLLSRAIVTEALEAARGKESAFIRLKDSRDRFELILNGQQKGSDTLGLSPVQEGVRPALEELTNRWKPIRDEIDSILAGREPVVSVNNFVPLLESSLTQMNNLSDEIAKSLASNRGDPRQVYQATKQLQLGEQIVIDLKRILSEGGLGAATAADRFSRNVNLFGRILRGMREGGQGIDRVTIPDSASKLADLTELFKTLEAETNRIIQKAPELVKVQNAAQGIADKGDGLLEATTRFLEATVAQGRQISLFGVPLGYPIAYTLGIVALVLLLALLFVQNRESRQQLVDAEQRKQETEEQNRRNQDAILRLLDELGNLAEGDLTVQASVTEDITGAIADSVNYAIEALRDLVSTINSTSGLVAAAVQETSAIADRLAKSSEIQARQIENASATVMQMAQSMDEVSSKTAASAEVAEKSVGIAHEGGDRVRRTISGMNTIREHIQDTSKRIKRLGESSQEIGEITELISDI
ncbi:MAG TPA: chemotaxis protein, partial [Gammaproteobacteria bacterium]|nr:chemotaxis protein [Gammaproteobacteria bacterium]